MTTGLLVACLGRGQHPRRESERNEMGGLRSAFTAFTGIHPRARLAERIAADLEDRLSADYVVLARYAPRDGSEIVPLVVLGPHGVRVVEPRDDDGGLVCYQDHWYRRSAPGVSHSLSDSPSKRAHANAVRVKSDLSSGGFIYTGVDSVVLLTRGQAEDVGSSCVRVIAGTDELVRHLENHRALTARLTHSRARGALSAPIRLASA